MPTSRLVRDVADRAQQHTQRSWKRPYGVGLLVAGCDKSGGSLLPAHCPVPKHTASFPCLRVWHLRAARCCAGARLFYNCPSGAYYDYKAMAIGARSQVWKPRQLSCFPIA